MSCTGACCEGFTLSTDGVASSHALVLDQQASESWMAQAVQDNNLARFAIPTSEPMRFNCSQFDSTTRRCTIYAQRPDTCRSFPVGAVRNGDLLDACHHCGATQ